MRDIFYTILVVWIIWRVLDSISAYGAKKKQSNSNFSSKSQRKEGETKVDYIPPTKNKISDEEGDYVDYEEVK
jgi:hypothetical protein